MSLSSPRRTTRVVAGTLSAAALALSGLAVSSPASTAAPAPAPKPVSATTLPGGLQLSTASIEDLQAGLTAGDFTSVELVEAYLARIAAIDDSGPRLNSVRQVAADARAQAVAADRARAAGETGPLLGIPILIKDNIDAAGMPTTAGSVALANSFPAADAPATAALREAGAIILGKTNLTEFANYTTSGMPAGYSSLGGQVLNAYDLSQTPSGSSAGSGVAASTALAAATVGSETSGSILSPSNANSLVGVKPTVGLISRTGVIPISASQDTVGPMARSVYDAAAVLTGLTTGADPEDPATTGADAYDDVDYTAGLSETALEGVRLGVVSSTNEVYNNALEVLEAQGATLVPVTAPAGSQQPGILSYEFERDLNAYLARLPESAPMDTLSDVIAFNDAHAAVALKFGQTLLTASEAVDLTDPAQLEAYETARDLGIAESRGNIDAVLEANDVDAIVSNAGTTGVGARAGYPSVTLPAGYAANNRRPVAITFLGTAYTEESLLGYAADFEAAADVWMPPEEVNPTAFVCTPLASADVMEECATPAPEVATSTTLASFVRNPVVKGTRAKVKVAIAAGGELARGRVTATVKGKVVGKATLNKAGRATFSLRKLAVGRHRVVLGYAGTATVAASKDTLTLKVRPKRRK
ncbi:amidase family protein [Nocardioides sp. zg-DK7169]|uniref:amidase family protein n=1 Tax=Nocardioides sp. zg-DK7169 TaxID=2736600 RepID=UPI00155722FA|nr:amidase family protein [Nocardioides sp. zg-DK7169]NPC97055.1 amidase [Nocardioides sp. zg-DK7169]